MPRAEMDQGVPLKILHFAPDDKFIPLQQQLFDAAFPGENQFVVPRPVDVALRYVQTSSALRIVSASYFGSQELGRDSKAFDALVVHSMTPLFAAGVRAVRPALPVVWAGWGYDYADLLTDDPDTMMLPESRAIQRATNARRVVGRAMQREVLWQTLKQRLAFLARNQDWLGRHSLRSIAARIDVFSTLPTEVEALRLALPRLVGKFHRIPAFTTEDVLDLGPQRAEGRDILLGNSATASNNHVEALAALRRVVHDDRNIVVPLNYGSPVYAAAVCKRGEALFGAAFQPLLQWLPLDEYHQRIANCGVVVMNHRRQQAVGNTSAALYRGAKVFLRPESAVYQWLSGMGAVIRSTDELDAPTSETLCPLSQAQQETNRQIIGELWNREGAIQSIRELASLTQFARVAQ